MEATQLLRKQHAEVKDLFGKFKSANGDERRRALFEEIADALAAHCVIEEKLFYPSVYVGPLKEQLQEAVEEHLAAKRVIADLLELESSDPQFAAKMTVLEEEIEHHVKEEEGELFPKVKKTFAKPELDALGEQMEALFDELQDENPREQVPAETGAAARLE
jgi:hemerythrin-like domain-containing protein